MYIASFASLAIQLYAKYHSCRKYIFKFEYSIFCHIW